MTEELFKKTVLTNGIRVVTENVDFVHSVALGLWVLVGSQDETEKTNGIAHFIEHMTFKGTSTRSAFEIASTIESLGGMLNAFTTRDMTCYFARLMYDNIETGIDVLSDLVQNPVFNREEIEREKGVIAEEIKEILDTPSDLVHDYFMQDLYPDHSFGRPVQGSIESINSFTYQNFVDFVHSNYTPDRIVVAVSGKVEHERIVELVSRYLGDLDSGIEKRDISAAKSFSQNINTYSSSGSQSHLVIGRRIFSQSDPRRHALAILSVILSGGMSSRIFHNIRERFGFVYAIYAFAELYRDQGLFGIYAGVDSRKLAKIKSLIYKEFEKLSDELVPDDELSKAKQQLKGGMVLSLESMQARMSRLARMEIFRHEFHTVNEYLKILEKISSEDIQTLAQYLFNKSDFIETILKPDKNR